MRRSHRKALAQPGIWELLSKLPERFESCSNRVPSSAGGGVDATSRRSSEAIFKWSGRGGVVKKFLDHTTPSARTNEASRLFLIVQPPLLLLRRGAR